MQQLSARIAAWQAEHPTLALGPLQRLWFDTHVEHPQVIELLTAAVGSSHLVYGTNFAGWDAPDANGGPSRYHVELDHALLSDNARRLLRADRA